LTDRRYYDGDGDGDGLAAAAAAAAGEGDVSIDRSDCGDVDCDSGSDVADTAAVAALGRCWGRTSDAAADDSSA